MKVARSGAVAVLAACALWAGLLVGVSFVATPVKFLAPSLSLTVALDVGRQTFWALNWIEIGCAVIFLAIVLAGYRTIFAISLAFLLAGGVLVQAFWLLPILDARVSMVIAGQIPPPSSLHSFYVVLEGLKLVLLAGLIMTSSRALVRHGTVVG
ncbi:MAG: hypothetical protein KIS73_24880 [Enhydrobacter sp.]|jgi:hypothetical protein|nr:hypothetical protein [Enhydrobacter sp.]